jgi:protein TonB
LPRRQHAGLADGGADGACAFETASAPDVSIDPALGFDDAVATGSKGVRGAPILDRARALGTLPDASAASAPLIDVGVRRAPEGQAATPGDGPFALNVAPELPIALDSEGPATPRWVRLMEALAVLLAHAAALTALMTIGEPLPPAFDTIEVTVVAASDEAAVAGPAAPAEEPGADAAADAKPPHPTQGAEAPTPTPPALEPANANAPPPVAEDKTTPPPEPTPAKTIPPVAAAQESPPEKPAPPDATPPPPPVAAAKAPGPPAAPALAGLDDTPPAVERRLDTPPLPRPPRVQTPPRPKPEARPEPTERPKPHEPQAQKTRDARNDAAADRPVSPEARLVGATQRQAAEGGSVSRASYAALVVAEIQAHRYYPELAREHGEQGAVGVSFTIGPTGRVASAAVVRPSGFADLDSAAREIVRSIAPPPPPGGSFSASTTIRFHVE